MLGALFLDVRSQLLLFNVMGLKKVAREHTMKKALVNAIPMIIGAELYNKGHNDL